MRWMEKPSRPICHWFQMVQFSMLLKEDTFQWMRIRMDTGNSKSTVLCRSSEDIRQQQRLEQHQTLNITKQSSQEIQVVMILILMMIWHTTVMSMILTRMILMYNHYSMQKQLLKYIFMAVVS